MAHRELAALATEPAAAESAPAKSAPAAPADSAPRFERDILPILTAHCLKCHGLEARQAGLDLRTAGLMTKGGESGPALVAGSLVDSPLYQRISDRSMPPEKELPLGEAKIALIRRWIAAGAPADSSDDAEQLAIAPTIPAEAREFWAFRRLRAEEVPRVATVDRARTAVDAFLLAKLEAQGLSYAPEADRATLVRRVFLDLTGLPPTPQETRDFLSDTADDAYDRLVDRLLASPHFGERWGRHWLDAAGYCDVIGDDTDRDIVKAPAGKWLYRDWVVRAVNEDKPYDRFLVEQIAGDELVDWRSAAAFTAETRDLLVATGFLRTAPDETLQNELNTADIRHQVLAQTVEVVTSNVLGLTLQCARCHSHKYDPIPQEDYYRLSAVFTPAFNVVEWRQPAQRELPDVSAVEQAAIDGHNKALDQRIGEHKKEQEAIRAPHRERLFQERLAAIPEPIRADTAAAVLIAADQRSEVQKYLAEKFGSQLKVEDPQVDAALPAAEAAAVQTLTAQIANLESQRRGYSRLQAVYDVGAPPPTHLLRRGNHETPGAEVAPGVFRVLCDADSSSALLPEAPYPTTSGRRLALARWLTQPDTRASALASRVYVNRAWQHVFGRGIVASSDNFGSSGAAPTHAELLDWLAARFIEGGWRLKPLVRLLVTSSAYRQASTVDAAAAPRAVQVDPPNDLLWHMRLRQLESEVVRDALLAVAGRLDRTLGGPPIGLRNLPDGSVVAAVDSDASKTGVVLGSAGNPCRRSLYILARRRYNLSTLEAFDQPEMARNCAYRSPSAVVTQSLAALNDAFWQEQAQAFAAQVRATAASDQASWIREAYLRAFAREPGDEEFQLALQLLAAQSQAARGGGASETAAAETALGHLCHMLLCSNEFLYNP